MGYQMKMLLRLAAPAAVVLVVGLGVAVMVSTLSSVPALLGGPQVFGELGDDLALGAGACALMVYAFQMYRYWRWTRDERDVCFVCACLLGREREGRYGPYRKCLGCGKNHSCSAL